MERLLVNVLWIFILASNSIADERITERMINLCQCLSNLSYSSRLVTLPECGELSQWSRCTSFSSCIEFPWETEDSGLNENYQPVENGDFLIIEAFKGRDEGIYKCENGNRTVLYNLTLYEKCYCSPIFIEPLVKNRIFKNLPGDRRNLTCSALVGPCNMNVRRCLATQANITWSFSRPDARNMIADSDHNWKRIAVKTDLSHDSSGIMITSTYSIENVADEDYDTYTCNVSNQNGYELMPMVLKYGRAENTIELPAPVFWTILTICILVASFLFVVLTVVIYYRILTIRVLCHLWFVRKEMGDYDHDGTIVCTDSVDDVAFVTTYLLPKAEDEMNFRLAFASRDFFVGSDDASYLEFMKRSRRIILLISSDFLIEPSICNRAFINALGQNRWRDMIFIILPNIDQALWTDTNCVLKETIGRCSDRPWSRIQKLNWDVKRKFCCFDLSNWEDRTFWERFLVAMPKARNSCNNVIYLE